MAFSSNFFVKFLQILIISSVLFCISACANHNVAVQEENLTVGVVQREIKLGMESAEVIEVLGSPNIVTTDSMRRETWVYDRISTTVQTSSSGGGAWILFFGGASTTSSKTSTQRALTIIIKFDETGKVRDFSYRTSTF